MTWHDFHDFDWVNELETYHTLIILNSITLYLAVIIP